MKALSDITKTLHSLRDDGKTAFVTSFKLLLYAINGLETDEKNQALQKVIPFITAWANVNVGESFSCGNPNEIQKEYQVYHGQTVMIHKFVGIVLD